MNKLIWIGVAIAVLAVLLGLRIHEAQSPPTSALTDISSFVYSHSGSSTDEMYSYEIDEDEESGETMVYYEFCNGNETYSLPVDAELMQGLATIIDSHNLRKWDGFSKTNSLVIDGDGFSLRIDFADGTEISARGSNSFPNGYSEAVNAIDELFQSHLKRHGIEPEGGYG